jgi:hypothetical protein
MNKKRIFLYASICMFLFCTMAVTAQITGDVNLDEEITIIDALLTAQHYVGLETSTFYEAVADVDADDDIDIVDALMIAQFYVGKISAFPASLMIPPLDEQYKVLHVPVIDLSIFEE